MVEWYQVPKTISGRLKQIHEGVEDLIKNGPDHSLVKEYFGISWEELDAHAQRVLGRYSDFLNDHINEEDGLAKALRMFYTLGFMTGVRFNTEEDHEPPDNN